MIDLEQYKLIVESSPNMIWRSNTSAECDYFNKTWLDFTGRSMEQEYGYGWAEGVHPDDLDRCVKLYMDNFNKQHKFEMDYRLKRYDGQYRWINDRGIPFYNKEGVFIGFIGSCMDITEKIEGQRLREMAQNDALCNTYNRQYSFQLLGEFFKQAQENGLSLSLLMMDIDDFKSINDNYGHAIGDKVLTIVATAVKNEIRDMDILGRYGGDEFMIGLVHTSLKEALKVAKRICSGIAKTEIAVAGLPAIKVTASIGVKCLEKERTLEELVIQADQKLYKAKKEGKNLCTA